MAKAIRKKASYFCEALQKEIYLDTPAINDVLRVKGLQIKAGKNLDSEEEAIGTEEATLEAENEIGERLSFMSAMCHRKNKAIVQTRAERRLVWAELVAKPEKVLRSLQNQIKKGESNELESEIKSFDLEQVISKITAETEESVTISR